LIYAFVLDETGNIMVHTFKEGFPADLLTVNEWQPETPYQTSTVQIDDDVILDLAVPVLNGKAGIIRLGMSEANVTAVVNQHIQNILIWVALWIVLGLAISFAFSSILTKPISQLALAARAVGRGDFQWEHPTWARDEIGALGIAFSEMSKELKHKEEMRKQLLAKIIGAQEDERKRISRELHDETGQTLTSLMVGLKSVENSTNTNHVTTNIAQLRALAAQTLDDVHHLSSELRPSVLDDLGLAAALKKYVQEYSVKMGVNVDSHISGLPVERLLPEVEIAIYRIVQEALTNIAKYATASSVSVILRFRDSKVIAIIEDNGRGFDVNGVMASKGEKQLGLYGMYERASLIGGKLTIESEIGVGTTIYLEVPHSINEQDKDTSGR
jgi:signal transduction histidine kinase